MQAPVAIPDVRFNRDHFHYPVINDTRSTCKVHLQKVKTINSCAICGVSCALCLVLKGITHCKTMFMVMKVVMAPVAKRREREAISKRKKKIFEKFFSVKEQLLCVVEALDLWLYDP